MAQMKIRKEIKERLKNLLKDELIVSDRVFLNRKQVIEHEDESNKGILLISLAGESASPFNRSPRTTKRILKLELTLLKTQNVEDIEGVEDTLEDLADQIEEKMFRWELSDLSEVVSDINYDGYDFAINEESERLEGAIKLNYSITYYKDETISDDELDDLNTHQVDLKNEIDNSFAFSLTHE